MSDLVFRINILDFGEIEILMTDQIKKNDEPRVGIFWYHKDKLIIESAPADEPKVIAGFADLDVSHYQVWEKMRAKYSDLRFFEYEEVPRGRVVMKAKGPLFVVYGSRALVNDGLFRAEIIKHFHLPANRTRFVSDAHYEDPSSIDWDC